MEFLILKWPKHLALLLLFWFSGCYINCELPKNLCLGVEVGHGSRLPSQTLVPISSAASPRSLGRLHTAQSVLRGHVGAAWNAVDSQGLLRAQQPKSPEPKADCPSPKSWNSPFLCLCRWTKLQLILPVLLLSCLSMYLAGSTINTRHSCGNVNMAGGFTLCYGWR